MAKNLRRISVQLDLDLARYSRETNEATLPSHLDAAAEAFIQHLEEIGFKVHEAKVRRTLGYVRHDFGVKVLRRAKKLRKVSR